MGRHELANARATLGTPPYLLVPLRRARTRDIKQARPKAMVRLWEGLRANMEKYTSKLALPGCFFQLIEAKPFNLVAFWYTSTDKQRDTWKP